MANSFLAQSNYQGLVFPAWTATADQVLREFTTDANIGLTGREATDRRQRFGPNELRAPAQTHWVFRFAGQFKSFVIWILLFAAVISGGLGEWVDTIAILAIVLINGILGFAQEEKANRSLEALKKLSAPMAKVRRDGKVLSIPAIEVVPGDLLLVEAGDHVPADGRIVEAFGLAVNEAALTGESDAVVKNPDVVAMAETTIGDRLNCLFRGTSITTGKGLAVVFATGMNTELGRVAGLLGEHSREPTPLESRMNALGRTLALACLAIVAIIFALQMARGGRPIDVLLSAVSLAVAAVPEGLPAVVTLALALGVQRMVRRNALIRRLPSVETLGSVTVICSDKTGTLTRNEMTVRELATADHDYIVDGVGYEPVGKFTIQRSSIVGLPLGTNVSPTDANGSITNHAAEPDLLELLTIGVECNDASISPAADGVGWLAVGDPTEAAILVAAMKAGVASALGRRQRLHEIPFDSVRKAMSVVVANRDGARVMCTKGAPETLLRQSTTLLRAGRCEPLTDALRDRFLAVAADMAGRAMRVLAFAKRELGATPEGFLESDLTFVGLVGIIDPPRREAKTAVEKCRTAGIRPLMITGDHPRTGEAIGLELGILRPGQRALIGEQLTQMDDRVLREAVASTSVYARVSAEHKQRIVAALKANGEIVAMTGDGVNDAPAVQAADIGIAMGISGSDVTKAAADMVLTDDNFASIVSAVEEGRGIFDNIQKVVLFLISCNAGEVLLMFVTALLGWPIPLTPIQLLWINLITDGPPALGLGMEPPEPGIMNRSPRRLTDGIISGGNGGRTIWHGLLVAGAALAGFMSQWHGEPEHLGPARTTAFAVMALCQLFLAIGCRSQNLTMPQLGFWTNRPLLAAIVVSCLLQFGAMAAPQLQMVFDSAPLSWLEWGIVIGLALTPVTVVELTKIVMARRRRANHG